jgi:glycosyltransferase involved in cell wall biosynthesis
MNIVVLLDGPIKNDGRVRRIIQTLSGFHKIALYYVDGDKSDYSLFNDNVSLFSVQKKDTWINRNVFFSKKFSLIEAFVYQQEKHIDILYCNDYPLLASAVRIKNRFSGAKLFYDSHEIYIETINQFFPTKGWKSIYGLPLIAVNKLFHSFIETKLVREIDLLITVGDCLKEHFEQEYDIKNILVIKNCPLSGIDPVRQDLIRKQLNLANDSLLVLYQGILNPGRGIENLIHAASMFEPNVHLIIIGDGVGLESYRKLASNNIDKIHFLGKLPFDKLLDYTASADLGLLFIQPINKSKRLSLPNKAFEYMAAGIPFITNSLPEASRIVKEKDCGIVLDKDSPKDIAAAINSLIDNRKQITFLGENGRKAYLEHYNWENEVKKLVALIEQFAKP